MLIRFRFDDVVYKSISIFFSLLLIFPVTATAANEQSTNYFPHTFGSFLGLRGSGRKQANTPCRREKND